MTPEIFHVTTFNTCKYAQFASYSAAMLTMLYGDGISCCYATPDDLDLDAFLKEYSDNDESRTVQLSKLWPDPTSDRLPSRQQARRPIRLQSTYG